MPWARHVYHVYTLRSQDRDGLQAALQAEGIQTGVHYPVPVHLQPAFADLGYGTRSLPQGGRGSRAGRFRCRFTPSFRHKPSPKWLPLLRKPPRATSRPG